MNNESEPSSSTPIRLTKDRAQILLDQQARSGLSIAAFAQDCGIAPQTLYRWRNLLKQTPVGSASLVNVTATLSSVSSRCAVVVFPNGTRLEHADLLSVEQLQALVTGC